MKQIVACSHAFPLVYSDNVHPSFSCWLTWLCSYFVIGLKVITRYSCFSFVRFIGGTMPLVKTLAWIFTVAMIVKSVVHEKERRLKEVMKVRSLI